MRTIETEVMAVPEPEFTETWHPMSHKKVLETLNQVLDGLGIIVAERSYSMTKNGQKMFGVWTLDSSFDTYYPTDDMVPMIGIRNSINKSMAVGICAGLNIIVCSNMSFSGKFVKYRRHTSGLDYPELQKVTLEAAAFVISDLKKHYAWLYSISTRHLGPKTYKQLTYDAFNTGILNSRDFRKYKILFKSELYNKPTLGNWYGVMTDLMKEKSLLYIGENGTKLTNFTKKAIETYPYMEE